MNVLLVAVLGVAATALILLVRRRANKTFEHVHGPPSTSWLFGNILQFNRQDQAGDLDFKWCGEFGPTWRLHGIFGQPVLMTADPKALQHIYHKSGYSYRKTADQTETNHVLFGSGIIWASGSVHQRHRKVMSPAFSAPQLRTFVPLHQRHIRKTLDIWKSEIETHSQNQMISCVHRWLTKTTLDIIGDAAFDYTFGAQSEAGARLLEAYSNVFVEAIMHPPKVDLLIKAVMECVPQPLLRVVEYLPLKDVTRMRKVRKAFEREAVQLLKDKTERLASGEEGKKDVMSLLVKANTSEDPKTRLSDAELTAQMATITIAGHDTTATTLTWLFYELAKNPEYQAKMRTEIRAVRSSVTARGEDSFSQEDLDSMTYCMAGLKYPVVSKTGELIHEVPVQAGQQIYTSFCAYNRLPQVWGTNADVWDPTRFLGTDIKRETNVGVFANLCGITRLHWTESRRGACMFSWRFSVMESQALIAEILEKFAFALPPNPPEIQRLPAGVMAPGIRGMAEMGIQMPLQISIVE
ncbi:hypothetical protein CERSUDRAFT_72211 [Gelatoporia subvermispora B]|uniref:Cytochrome P450 n=1 Tax=Ceriporiopsis subvermispora (strain B) TaxID=914234 RepID=M2R360_CERS8|nr:hypothetical protein CERSUDRAFT_72211 [Gelatoporia subvermispora B]